MDRANHLWRPTPEYQAVPIRSEEPVQPQPAGVHTQIPRHEPEAASVGPPRKVARLENTQDPLESLVSPRDALNYFSDFLSDLEIESIALEMGLFKHETWQEVSEAIKSIHDHQEKLELIFTKASEHKLLTLASLWRAVETNSPTNKAGVSQAVFSGREGS